MLKFPILPHLRLMTWTPSHLSHSEFYVRVYKVSAIPLFQQSSQDHYVISWEPYVITEADGHGSPATCPYQKTEPVACSLCKYLTVEYFKLIKDQILYFLSICLPHHTISYIIFNTLFHLICCVMPLLWSVFALQCNLKFTWDNSLHYPSLK